MPTMPPVQAVADRIEKAEAVDGVASRLQNLLRRALPPAATDMLGGEPLGHPLHPLLVVLPIGAWGSASVLDLLGEQTAARKLTAFGCAAALPTAASGAVDWASTSGPQRRTGLVHASLNYAALTTYFASWRARRRGRRVTGSLLSMAGFGLLTAGGWLGGHLAYSQGVGVDTEEFRQRNPGSGGPAHATDGMVVVEPGT